MQSLQNARLARIIAYGLDIMAEVFQTLSEPKIIGASSLAFSWVSGRYVRQFAALFLCFLLTAAIIYFDILVLGSIARETSVIELSQSALILGSALFFAAGARKFEQKRGYLVLVSTLFLAMFVRENDGFLDSITHGFWRVPVLLILLGGALIIARNRGTTKAPLLDHVRDGSFWILAIGLLQLIVFSRLFGSGQLWSHVVSQDVGVVKTVVQEGIELVSYALIFLGAYLSHKYRFEHGPAPVEGAER